MSFEKTWSETTPNNSTNANQIDDKVVEFKVAERERQAVEHCRYADETGHTDVGEHKQGSARIGFGVAGNRPANNSANPGRVYVTLTAGVATKIEYDNGSAWVDVTDISGAFAALANYLKKDGSVGLTSAWNAGQNITAPTFTGALIGTAETAMRSSTCALADNSQQLGGKALSAFALTYTPSNTPLIDLVGEQYFNSPTDTVFATFTIPHLGRFRFAFEVKGTTSSVTIEVLNYGIVQASGTYSAGTYTARTIDTYILPGITQLRVTSIGEAWIRQIYLKGTPAALPAFAAE